MRAPLKCLAGIAPMFERILVAPGCAGPFGATMHAAALLAFDGRRPAGHAGTSPRVTTRTRQHGCRVSLMVAAIHLRSRCAGVTPRRQMDLWSDHPSCC